MTKTLLLVLALAACGDNLEPDIEPEAWLCDGAAGVPHCVSLECAEVESPDGTCRAWSPQGYEVECSAFTLGDERGCCVAGPPIAVGDELAVYWAPCHQ